MVHHLLYSKQGRSLSSLWGWKVLFDLIQILKKRLLQCSLPPSWHNHGKSWQESAFKTQLQKLTVTFERTHFCLKEKKKNMFLQLRAFLYLAFILTHCMNLTTVIGCSRALNTLGSTNWADHCVGPWVIKMHQRLYSCCSSIDYSLRLQESCFPDFLDLSQFQIIPFLVQPQLLGDKGLPCLICYCISVSNRVFVYCTRSMDYLCRRENIFLYPSRFLWLVC